MIISLSTCFIIIISGTLGKYWWHRHRYRLHSSISISINGYWLLLHNNCFPYSYYVHRGNGRVNWESWFLVPVSRSWLLHGTAVDVADVPENGSRCGGSEKIARIPSGRCSGGSGTEGAAQAGGTAAQSAGPPAAAILHHKVLLQGRLVTQLLETQLILSLPLGAVSEGDRENRRNWLLNTSGFRWSYHRTKSLDPLGVLTDGSGTRSSPASRTGWASRPHRCDRPRWGTSGSGTCAPSRPAGRVWRPCAVGAACVRSCSAAACAPHSHQCHRFLLLLLLLLRLHCSPHWRQPLQGDPLPHPPPLPLHSVRRPCPRLRQRLLHQNRIPSPVAAWPSRRTLR